MCPSLLCQHSICVFYTLSLALWILQSAREVSMSFKPAIPFSSSISSLSRYSTWWDNHIIWETQTVRWVATYSCQPGSYFSPSPLSFSSEFYSLKQICEFYVRIQFCPSLNPCASKWDKICSCSLGEWTWAQACSWEHQYRVLQGTLAGIRDSSPFPSAHVFCYLWPFTILVLSVIMHAKC